MPSTSKLFVPYSSPLIRAKLLRRRHRFIIDARLDCGSIVSAHCAHSGRMEGLVRPGSEIYLSRSTGNGKLKYRWELINIEGSLFSTNSWSANIVSKALLEQKQLIGLRSYKLISCEPKVGTSSRADFLLRSRNKSVLVEVKAANLIYPDGIAYFPDSLTVRAVRQLDDLTRAISKGHHVCILVVVLCGDVSSVRPSDIHDPALARKLRQIAKLGARIKAVHFQPQLRGMKFQGELKVDLKPYDLGPVAKWKLANSPYSGWERPSGDPSAAWRLKPVIVRRETRSSRS